MHLPAHHQAILINPLIWRKRLGFRVALLIVTVLTFLRLIKSSSRRMVTSTPDFWQRQKNGRGNFWVARQRYELWIYLHEKMTCHLSRHEFFIYQMIVSSFVVAKTFYFLPVWHFHVVIDSLKLDEIETLNDFDRKAGKVMNGVVFVISISSQLTYFYDAQTGLVEKCITNYPGTLKVKFV